MDNYLNFVNSLDKEDVYYTYNLIIPKPKKYEQITKKEMIQELYHSLSRPDALIKYVSPDSIKVLKKFISTNNYQDFLAEVQAVDELFNSYLIFRDPKAKKLIVPDEVKNVVIQFEINENDQERDDFYYFFFGLLLTRGKIKIKEAESIYLKLKPKDFNFPFNTIYDFYRLFFKIDYFLLIEEDILALHEFHDYENIIIDDYHPIYNYTFDTYITIGKYRLNLEIPILKEFYDVIINDDFIILDSINRIILGIQTHPFLFYKYLELLISEHIDRFYSSKDANLIFKQITGELPTWKYKGDPMSFVDDESVSDYKYERHEYNLEDLCPCGSGLKIGDCCWNKESLLKDKAILPPENQQESYGLLRSLLFYVSSHYLNKYDNFDDFNENITDDEFIDMKELTFENPELIKEFHNGIKGNLPPFIEELFTGYYNSYSQLFLAIKYIDKKLLLFDYETKNSYLLSGIQSAISESIPNEELPRLVKIRLIPLKDRIIYDVFINKLPAKPSDEFVKSAENSIKASEIIDSIKNFKKGLEIISLNQYNINDYKNFWIDIMKLINPNNPIKDIIKEVKMTIETFIDFNKIHFLGENPFDYYYYGKVLEYNGKKIGFIFGIIRYFENEEAYFQIGYFGVLKKYQGNGYAKHLLLEVIDDLRGRGVNGIWGIMRSDGFWSKMDFMKDKSKTKTLADLYSNIDVNDNIYYLDLYNEKMSWDDFANMFTIFL